MKTSGVTSESNDKLTTLMTRYFSSLYPALFVQRDLSLLLFDNGIIIMTLIFFSFVLIHVNCNQDKNS